MIFLFIAIASAAGMQCYLTPATCPRCMLPLLQAWVYVCEELREVVVAFRGTEQVRGRGLQDPAQHSNST